MRNLFLLAALAVFALILWTPSAEARHHGGRGRLLSRGERGGLLHRVVHRERTILKGRGVVRGNCDAGGCK